MKKNITEDYVSFKVAKLLKENGFDWEDSPFYSEQDRDEWRQNNSYTVPNEEYNPELPFDSETLTMVAPHISLQTAMKWLREVHKLYIEICTDTALNLNDIVFRHAIFNKELSYLWESDNYPTYEQAAEAAIKYCLTNLI